MTGHLESSRAKVGRAVEHFGCLHEACERFEKSEPHEVTVDFESDAGCYVARLHVRREPPHDIPLMLGDLIHNLRAALDHAAWKVARLCHSEEALLKSGTRNLISFPVTYHANEFASHPLIGFIPEGAEAAFRPFQPYHEPDPRQHWLAHLNRLWNTDKHRLLHPAFALSYIGKTTFVPGALLVDDMQGGAEVDRLIRRGEGIEDGAAVAHIRFAAGPRPRSQRVRVKRQPPAQLVFGTGAETCDLWRLGTMAGTTASVLDRVDALFE